MDLLGRIDWTLIGSIVVNVLISLATAFAFFYKMLRNPTNDQILMLCRW